MQTKSKHLDPCIVACTGLHDASAIQRLEGRARPLHVKPAEINNNALNFEEAGIKHICKQAASRLCKSAGPECPWV